eukprot:392591-Alexandrium_andersonii.AAC.1
MGDMTAGRENPMEAMKKYLYEYNPMQTIFDRFTDIPSPGGIRMIQRIVECYGVPGLTNTKMG